MYFSNWLQKNKKGEYVHRKTVLKYLKKKVHPMAREIEEEIHSEGDVKWIPILVWHDAYYEFK